MTLICKFLQGIWLHTQTEVLSSSQWSPPKRTVATILMQNKNTKVEVLFPDRDIDFFDVVAGILQGDTLAPSLFIIYQDYVLRTSITLRKVKWFYTGKGKKQTITAQTITDAGCADDIAFLSNTPTQGESLLHSMKQAVGGIGLPVNCRPPGVHVIYQRDAPGVMVIVVGNGHDDTSSKPGRDWLHFTLH